MLEAYSVSQMFLKGGISEADIGVLFILGETTNKSDIIGQLEAFPARCIVRPTFETSVTVSSVTRLPAGEAVRRKWVKIKVARLQRGVAFCAFA